MITLIDERKFFCQSLRKSQTNERVCHFYVICGVKLTRLAASGIPHVNVVMLGDVQSIGNRIAIASSMSLCLFDEPGRLPVHRHQAIYPSL